MRKNKMNNKGFTLIEILVVMAISVILVGLVLEPVVQSFQMTRQAEAMSDAQDAARTAMQQIERELGQAMFVYDNTAIDDPVYNNQICLPVRQPDKTIQNFYLSNAKIDFILPLVTMHCDNPDHPADQSRDYPRRNPTDPSGGIGWPNCPVCEKAGLDATMVEARPQLPMRQDTMVVRYFIGLRYNDPDNTLSGTDPSNTSGNDPFGYLSAWHGLVTTGEENQVVLYRVEFDPHDNTLFPATESIPDRLSDPNFFYQTGAPSGGVPYWQAWQNIATVIGIGTYEDLVNAYDSAGNLVSDPTVATASVVPTISFKFSAIENDTFSAAYSSDTSSEYPNTAPSVFQSTYGYWLPGDCGVTVYSADYSTAYTSEIDSVGDFWVDEWVNSGGSPPSWSQSGSWDITQYMDGSGSSPNMAFTYDLNSGRVNFAFPMLSGNDNTALGCINTISAPSGIDQINTNFHTMYNTDRGSAVRSAQLITIADTAANCPHIVPGSEKVVGPNQTPGANSAIPVRYERVPVNIGEAGLNQYKIDYDTGEIYFSPVYDQDLPDTASFTIDYKVHFNQPDDIVRGQYTTKSLVKIDLGMIIYDPDTANPHEVDISDSVKVRNALR